MTYPTDAAIEAGAEGLWLCDERSYQDHPLPWVLCCDRYPGTADRYRDMTKAALIAARAADPPPSLAEIRKEVARMDAHYPHYDENGNPSEWLSGVHYALKMVLGTIDDLFRRATGEGVGE